MFAYLLDVVVWEKVKGVLLDPDRIARELERMRETDPTEADLSAVEKASECIDQQLANIVRAIAMVNDPDAAAPLAAELKALAERSKQFAAERADILAWCRTVAANIDNLTYDKRRDTLIALGVEVKVWRADHSPRYEITMRIPLVEAAQDVTFVKSEVVPATGGVGELMTSGGRRTCYPKLAHSPQRDSSGAARFTR